jgi:hypothetical protein
VYANAYRRTESASAQCQSVCVQVHKEQAEAALSRLELSLSLSAFAGVVCVLCDLDRKSGLALTHSLRELSSAG